MYKLCTNPAKYLQDLLFLSIFADEKTTVLITKQIQEL